MAIESFHEDLEREALLFFVHFILPLVYVPNYLLYFTGLTGLYFLYEAAHSHAALPENYT